MSRSYPSWMKSIMSDSKYITMDIHVTTVRQKVSLVLRYISTNNSRTVVTVRIKKYLDFLVVSG